MEVKDMGKELGGSLCFSYEAGSSDGQDDRMGEKGNTEARTEMDLGTTLWCLEGVVIFKIE
jgi:hypothetical protein